MKVIFWKPSNLFTLTFPNNILSFTDQWQQWFHLKWNYYEGVSQPICHCCCEWSPSVSQSSIAALFPLWPQTKSHAFPLGRNQRSFYSGISAWRDNVPLTALCGGHRLQPSCFILGAPKTAPSSPRWCQCRGLRQWLFPVAVRCPHCPCKGELSPVRSKLARAVPRDFLLAWK